MTDFDPDVGLEGLLIDDDYTPSAPSGVPAGFNLLDLLSESMRERPAWRDMAKVASRVLYDYVDKYRISLELSRSPENLTRSLKIATLRMLGIDWKSTNLTDLDYDRLIEAVSVYQESHGTKDFARFMGYALGVPLELMPLWTKDYLVFDPESINHRKVWQSPPGEYYPTTHVGLLYEEFAANVDKIDEPELREMFYQLAPMNLVLEWIGSQVTTSVTLLMSLRFYERSEDTLVTRDKQINLFLSAQQYERSEDTIEIPPRGPVRNLTAVLMAGNTETSIEGVPAARVGVDWDLAAGLTAGNMVPSGNNDRILSRDTLGNLKFGYDPDPLWTTPSLNHTGATLLPPRYGVVKNSQLPISQTWIKTANTAISSTSLLNDLVYRLTTSNQAIVTTHVEVGTHLVSFTYKRVSGAKCVKIVRGTDQITFDATTGLLVSNTLGLECGVIHEGSGYYTIWARMTGGDLTLYAAWGDDNAGSSLATSVVDWYNFGADRNAHFPRNPFAVNATVPFFQGDSKFDAGGTGQCEIDYGFALYHLVLLFPEWTYSAIPLFEIRGSTGDYVRCFIDTTAETKFSVKAPSVNSTITTSLVPNTDVVLKVGLKWNRPQGSLRLYAGASHYDISAGWPTNFAATTILRYFGDPVAASAVLKRCIITGYSDLARMPDDSTMTWLFS